MMPRSLSKPGLLLCVGLAFGVPAWADVFKCVDAQGRITYTNDKTAARNCTGLNPDLPFSNVGSAPRSRSSSAGASSSGASVPSSSPTDFPKVTPETQRNRDGSRRQILEQELATEENALTNARRALSSEMGKEGAQPGAAHLQPIRDQIDLHQRNVDAIKREIANLR